MREAIKIIGAYYAIMLVLIGTGFMGSLIQFVNWLVP